MKIDSKVPVGLIVDISSFTNTLDSGRAIPLLVWHYTIERILIDYYGVTVKQSAPWCPSLESFYRLIMTLQELHGLSFVDMFNDETVRYLRHRTVMIEMTYEIIVVSFART